MAKQCCVCKQRLGFLNSGFELGNASTGYLLCSECNYKRLDLRTVKSEEDYRQKIAVFSRLLDDPTTPTVVRRSITQLGEQGLKNLGLGREAKLLQDEQKKRKFNGSLPVYEFFVPKPFTLVSAYSYETNVAVLEDRVYIEWTGLTLGIPREMEIPFCEIASIGWGEAGRLAWIRFIIPGVTGNKGSMPTAILKNGLIVNEVELVPYDDAYSIILDTVKDVEAKKHYSQIKQCYEKYKVSEQSGTGTALYMDSAVDKLRKLKELKELGILSESEYEEKRQKLLAEI